MVTVSILFIHVIRFQDDKYRKSVRTHLKNTIFWNLDLSSNTQSKGDLWFKCELFIVFVNFQNLNLCRDKANAKLHLNNNGAHSSFWFTYSSSRGSFVPWNHGLYSWVDIDIRISHYYRILMSPSGCRLDHWVTFIPPEMEVILIYGSKCGWLSQTVNISLFQFYGLCLKGFGSENGPLLKRRKSVPMRQ